MQSTITSRNRYIMGRTPNHPPSEAFYDVEDYEWDKPQYDDGSVERYVRSLSNQKLIFVPGQTFAIAIWHSRSWVI